MNIDMNLNNVFFSSLFLGSKDQSPSVASFEELQGVIDFLSGSSSSSLAINEKGEKKKLHIKAHKRNNSTTSLQIDSKTKSKVVPEGKLKLCHKKSASFSGNSAADKKETSESDKDQDIEKLKRMSAELDNGIKTDNIENNTVNKDNKEASNQEELKAIEKDDESSSSNEESIPFIERTPGDGMDNKQEKTVSTVNIKKHIIDNKEEESATNNDLKNVTNDEKETKDILKEDLRRNSSPELTEQLKKSDTKINEKSQPINIQVNSLDSTVKGSGILSKETNTKNAEVINVPSPKPRLSKLDPGNVEGSKMFQQNKVFPVKMVFCFLFSSFIKFLSFSFIFCIPTKKDVFKVTSHCNRIGTIKFTMEALMSKAFYRVFSETNRK